MNFGGHLREHEVAVEADEVEHPAAHEVRDALAGLALGRPWFAPTRARILPCDRETAFAQICGTFRSTRFAVMAIRCSTDDPTATTATWKSCAPICFSAPMLMGVRLHGVRDAPGPLLHEVEVLVDREYA